MGIPEEDGSLGIVFFFESRSLGLVKRNRDWITCPLAEY